MVNTANLTYNRKRGGNNVKKVSIVVPCYNEEESLPIFYETIVKIAKELKDKVVFEFLFIDDGSKDKTLSVLKDLVKQDKRVRYISFSRNFGKEAAMLAGLEHAKGDYVTIMDADLQDPPSLLAEMCDFLAKMLHTRLINSKRKCYI